MSLPEISTNSGLVLNDVKVVIRKGLKIGYKHYEKGIYASDEIYLIHNESGILVSEIPVGFLERGYQYSNRYSPILEMKPDVDLSSAILMYSNEYCHQNYEHLLLDVFPKVFVHLEELKENEVKFIIPTSKFTPLISEFLLLLGFENDALLIVDRDFVAKVGHLYEFVSNATYPFDDRPAEFYSFLCALFSKRSNQQNTETKKIFLGRLEGERTGKGRYISNFDEVKSFLDKNEFSIVDVASMGFLEKSEALSNSEIVITEIGANCNNVLISTGIEKFLMIGHNKWRKEFYKTIFDSNNPTSESEILLFEPVNPNHDVYNSKENVNIPYFIEIEKLANTVEIMLNGGN